MSPATLKARAPGLLHHLRGLVGILMLLKVGDQHVGSLAGEGQRDRPADATVGTRDERHFTLEAAASAVALRAVVRPRLHRGLPTGRLLLLHGEGRLWRLLGRVLRSRLIGVHEAPLLIGSAWLRRKRRAIPGCEVGSEEEPLS